MANIDEIINKGLDDFNRWRKNKEMSSFINLLKSKSPEEVEKQFWIDMKRFMSNG